MANQPRPSWVEKNPLTTQIYDIVESFLSDSTRKVSDAANLLTSTLLPYTRTISDVENVECLWGTILWTASTFSPGAMEHWRLIELVREIQRTQSPTGAGVSEDEELNSREWWVDLPRWYEVWADLQCDAPMPPSKQSRKERRQSRPTKFTPRPWRRDDGKPMPGSAWTSLNAFAAKLYAETPLDHLGLIGTQSVIEALEREMSPTDLDNVVPAASCWIISAGKDIFDYSQDFDTAIQERSNTLALTSGDLYKGMEGLADERWKFWKNRFAALSKRQDLSPNTRLFASQAKDEMTCIEVRK